MPFSSNYRKLPEMVVKRFRQVRSGRWSAFRRIFDSIKFEVDTPVFILGFGRLYGFDQGCCQYSVLIKISNSNTGELLASNECSFLSNGTSATFRVMFEKPVEISPNTSYLASSKLTGIYSYYGEDGLHKIKVERNGLPDINWHFQDAASDNNNDTTVEFGQIPEIIFYTMH